MGKIGIILAFLLSVAAAGGSYYLYQGWGEERIARGTVEAKYDQVKYEKEQIRAEKEQIKAEKEQITAKSEQYRTKAEAMQAQVETLRTEQSRIDSEKALLEKQLKSHQDMITDLQAKMVALEKKAKEAQAACGVTPADLTANPLAAAASLKGATSSTGTSQLAFKPVTSSSASSTTPTSVVVTPPATGVSSVTSTGTTPASETATTTGPKVLTVNRKFNFVVINQGLQEGLKMGDKLNVLKDGKEVATVQIEKLYDKFSAATLVEEDPKQQVVEGDEIRKV